MTSTNLPASAAKGDTAGEPPAEEDLARAELREADPMAERAADIAADDPGDAEVDPSTATVTPPPQAPHRTPLRVARGVLRTMRPKQWVKNVLVLAAPFAGGVLFSAGIAAHLVVAFVAFSLAASGIYLVNDANDVEADRAHPTKRRRPIAAGIVPVPLALAVGAVLLIAALLVSLLASVQLTVVVGVYAPSSSPTASGSNTSRCWTSASSRRASCCARSRAARPPASRSRSGSCSPPGSGRCSWWRASATPR